MELFLTTVAIGLIIATAVVFIADDLRFIRSHLLCTHLVALGFGVSMIEGRNLDILNGIGVVVMLFGLGLLIKLEIKYGKSLTCQT